MTRSRLTDKDVLKWKKRLEKALLEAPPDVILVGRLKGLAIVDGSHRLFLGNDLSGIPKEAGVWKLLEDPMGTFDGSSSGD